MNKKLISWLKIKKSVFLSQIYSGYNNCWGAIIQFLLFINDNFIAHAGEKLKGEECISFQIFK